MKEAGLIEDAGYPDEEAGGSADGGIPLPMVRLLFASFANVKMRTLFIENIYLTLHFALCLSMVIPSAWTGEFWYSKYDFLLSQAFGMRRRPLTLIYESL